MCGLNDSLVHLRETFRAQNRIIFIIFRLCFIVSLALGKNNSIIGGLRTPNWMIAKYIFRDNTKISGSASKN